MRIQSTLAVLLLSLLAFSFAPPPAAAQDEEGTSEFQRKREEIRRRYLQAALADDLEGKKSALRDLQALQYTPPPPKSPTTPGPGSNPGSSPTSGGGNPGQSGGGNPGQTGGNSNPASPAGPGPTLGPTGPPAAQAPGTGTSGNAKDPAAKPEEKKSALDGLTIGANSNWDWGGKPIAKNPDGSNKFEKFGKTKWSKDEGWKKSGEDPFPDKSIKDRTEVGIDVVVHKKDRELKKYETETSEDFEKRKDLVKGRAGVRFGTADTNANVGAKWNVGTGEVYAGATAGASVTAVSAEAEGQIGNDKLAAKGKASGSVLKAEAKLDARIGNSKDFAGAKVEAGVGGSVLEGQLSGSVGSKWLGLEVGGEVTGSVLTAEAKGVASAGYNKQTGKFEVEVGGKIGALLLGGGARVKIAISKPGWWPW